MQVLDLSRTQISKIPEHFLHTPRYLKQLVLAGNLFPEPPEGLSDSHALQHLDMSENPFTTIRSVTHSRTSPSAGTCDSKLSIRHNRMSRVLIPAPVLFVPDANELTINVVSFARSIARMDSLTTLVISHCPNLTVIEKEALAALPALSRLYLHSNRRLATIHAMALAAPPTPTEETHVWPPLETVPHP